MKSNYKFRSLKNDNKGVSEVIGTILLIAITVSAGSLVIAKMPNILQFLFDRGEDVTNAIVDEKIAAHEFKLHPDNDNSTPTTPEDNNNPPIAFSPWPPDQAQHIPIKPVLRITVQDLDRDNLYIDLFWYNLSLKRYQRINKELIEGFSGQIITCNFTQCNSNCQYYNWYVTVGDGRDKYTTPVYVFKTEALQSP